MNTGAPPPPAGDIVEGGIVGDHFRILRKLGAGGMGEVYLAENANLPDKRYAIKVLRKELSSIDRYGQLLQQEAARQARLDHENIVQLYDYFRWGQRDCLVLAFVEGGSLAGMIEAEPKGFQEARALGLMRQILEGVNHAHEHGVLHCDIKPANVLVDKEQRVRVTDFGIARDLGAAAGPRRGVVVGTPEYMSPEQIRDPDHVDHRTDVYSAGVVLFEMLTGRLPFAHEGEPGGSRFPQLAGEPADLLDYRRDLSPRLARIVATALQPLPAARFQGCMDFLEAIVGYRRRQRWRRTWLPAIVAASVLAVAGTAGFYKWNEAQEARRDAQARKTIEASIGTAVQQLRSLCREAVRLEARQAGVATASAAGYADLVAKLQSQVDDMRRNMADYATAYSGQIGELTKFKGAMVEGVLGRYEVPDDGAPRYLSALRADYADLAARRPVRSGAALLSTCPE